MSTYDPFSYGQIKLGGDAKRAAETPDDILFQDAGPGPSTAMKAANSDWELLEDKSASPPGMQTDTLQAAMDFGADVLGEAAPPSPPRPQVQRSAGSQATARAQAPVPMPSPVPAARPKPPSAQMSAKPRPKPATSQPPMRPAAASNRMLAALLPSVTIACGGSAAAWLYAMEHNPIMASIVGVTSLIAAAFLRVLFRS